MVRVVEGGSRWRDNDRKFCKANVKILAFIWSEIQALYPSSNGVVEYKDNKLIGWGRSGETNEEAVVTQWRC